MAKQKFTPEQRADFHTRLAAIENYLPVKDIENKVYDMDNTLKFNRIYNVRYGRTIDFHILSLLEKIAQQRKEEKEKVKA